MSSSFSGHTQTASWLKSVNDLTSNERSADDAYAAALGRLLSVPSSPRFGLERMAELLHRLGDPQHRFFALHVAGTNGKGSTCAFLDAALATLGVSRGLCTSPHLSSARERIRIQGELVSTSEFIALEKEVYEAASAMADPPTFFERMTAMSFLAFAAHRVDVAVVEVGLGGRLDATNLVRPIACGITRLGLDHQQFLGHRLGEIAGEKAGIFKPSIPARSVEQEPDAAEVLYERAREQSTPFRTVNLAEREAVQALSLPLAGAHQLENCALALAMLRASGLATSDAQAVEGFAHARWPGRFECISGAQRIWLDGAHNPAAAQVLAQTLRDDPRTRNKPIYLLLGMTRGHDIAPFARMLSGLPLRKAYAVRARAPRSIAAEELVAGLRAGGISAVAAHPWDQALDELQNDAAAEDGIVLVTGSLYLVGEVRAQRMDMPSDPQLPEF